METEQQLLRRTLKDEFRRSVDMHWYRAVGAPVQNLAHNHLRIGVFGAAEAVQTAGNHAFEDGVHPALEAFLHEQGWGLSFSIETEIVAAIL